MSTPDPPQELPAAEEVMQACATSTGFPTALFTRESPEDAPIIVPTPARVKKYALANLQQVYTLLVHELCEKLRRTVTGVVTHPIPHELKPSAEALVQAFTDAGYHCRVHDRGRSITVALPELKYFDAPVEEAPPQTRPREDASNVPALVAALFGTVAVVGAVVAWVLL